MTALMRVLGTCTACRGKGFGQLEGYTQSRGTHRDLVAESKVVAELALALGACPFASLSAGVGTRSIC